MEAKALCHLVPSHPTYQLAPPGTICGPDVENSQTPDLNYSRNNGALPGEQPERQ